MSDSVKQCVDLFFFCGFFAFVFLNNVNLPRNLLVLVLSELHDKFFFYMHNATCLFQRVRMPEKQAQTQTHTHTPLIFSINQ